MTTHKNLMTLCVAAVFAVGLAACGGGNGDGPAAMDETPPALDVLDLSDLTDDQKIDAGEYTVAGLPADTPEGVPIPIPADGFDIGDATFSCSGDEACTVMVDGTTLTTTGTITVAIADTAPVDPPVDPGPTDPPPTPVAVNVDDVTEGYEVADGTLEISAGETMTHGDVDFTCAAGEDDCTVMVADGTATSTGGTVTAMNSADYAQSLVPGAVTLPDVTADYGDDVEELSVRTGTYEISAGDTMTVGDVDITCAMGGRDCSVEVMADGTVESTGGDVSTVVTLAYLERQLAAVNQRNEKLETDQAAKVASDKAKAVLAALNIAVGASPTGTAPEAEDIKIAASSDGDLTNVESAGYTKSAYPDAITGFRGAILTTDDAELHVYTDIEDSVATPISDIYRASSDPGESKTYTVLVSGGDNDILWPQAMRADEVTTETGTEDTAVTAFMGDVRGVDGMFSCTGADCTAPAPNADGDLTGAGGDWTFAPTDPNGTIDVADEAYLSFGWWLNKMDDDSYEVDVFYAAAAGMTANTGAGSVLEGTATYRGGAAGKFAIQSTTEDSAEGRAFHGLCNLGGEFRRRLGRRR